MHLKLENKIYKDAYHMMRKTHTRETEQTTFSIIVLLNIIIYFTKKLTVQGSRFPTVGALTQ